MQTKILRIGFIFFFLLLPFFSQAQSPFDYTPLENIPGFESEMDGDFYTYVSLVYKFGIWAVGIAALLMITIGGFMYVTSAGNNSYMEKAKGVITDAIIGLILALTSYLLLYIINPDLVKITPLEPVTPSEQTDTVGSGVGAPGGVTKGGNGSCAPITSGPCAPSNLSCFGSNAETFSAICNKESGGEEKYVDPRSTDKCSDGTIFSIGLFQINMVNSAGSLPACNDPKMFTINKSGGNPACSTFGSSQGSCLSCTKNSAGTPYCSQWNCMVNKSSSSYSTCQSQLLVGANNISVACKLSNSGTKTSPWSTTARACGFTK